MAKAQATPALALEPRDAAGTTTAHALRAAGKIPGVVYGHGSATPIVIDAKELAALLASPDKGHVVDATIGNAKDSVLLRKVEVDPISRKPLSVDFQRVSRDEAVTATLTVHVKGNARGVRDKGGVLDIVTHSLQIKGPSGRLPEFIEIDVTELDVHQHVNASAVQLPDGFTMITPGDTTVVSVEIHRAAAVETEATPAAADITATPPTA